MTANPDAHSRSGSSSVRVLFRLIANQPVRYPISLAMWTGMWAWPLAVGVVTQRYFDGLAGSGGWPVATVVFAAVGWMLVRVVGILVAMRWHAGVIFRAGASMMRNMLRWVFRLPGARPVRQAPGEVVSRFRDDVDHTMEAFDFTVDFTGAILAAAISFVVLATIDPFLAGVAFVPMLVVLVLVWLLSARIRRYREAARDATEEMTGFLGESFSATQSIKVAGAEDAILGRFATLNDRRRSMMVRDRTLTAATDAMGQTTGTIGTGLVLLLAAGTLGNTSGDALTVGQFALFSMLLGHTAFGAYFIGTFMARLRQAGVSFDRMVDLMAGGTWQDLAEHSVLETPLPIATVPDRPGVEPADATDVPLLSVRGLTHAHPDAGGGIVDIDLDVHEGQLVVVTGRVGAGKTTLLQVILGLLPADRGEIAWRGWPIADPARFMVPPVAAYTPQVPRLFSMNLRDNLLMGLPGEDDLAGAIETATMSPDLGAMPDGLETMVGPRGMRLSGGQIQRSAAARMLVRRPELLVFDDLSSALDVETEAALWSRLFDEATSTALVVSHRRPALERADQVVVLEAGRVVARGTAAELRDQSPVFRQLWG